ncbi:rhodanese-like domain-containing protein [Wenyingzhuangia sp. IMCC45533]
MKIFYTLLVGFILNLSCQNVNADQLKKDRMKVVAFKEAIAHEDIQLIDVRTLNEFNSGHIKNAVLMDVMQKDNFKKEIEKLDVSKPTYIYCRSGVRSLTALKIMKEKGFKVVYDLEGGYVSWLKNN